MKVSFEDRDKGWNKLKIEVKKAGKSYTEVGYPVEAKESKEKYKKISKGQKKQLTTLDVAMIQEFGTSDGRVPARPFIRSYFDKDNRKIEKVVKNLYSQILVGRETTVKALGKIGEFVKKGIQKNITYGSFRPLAESTVKARLRFMAKSRSKAKMAQILQKPIGEIIKPLINTGQMRRDITHKETIKGG